MRIVVDSSAAGDPRFLLLDAEVLDAFAADVPAGLAAADLRAALAASGGRIRLDGDHLSVEPGWLRAAAGGLAEDDDWSARFEAMLAYATRKGWVDADGGVRAHIVRG